MWKYSQARGLITHNDRLEGSGYSGNGIGLNNGQLEAEPNMGPIPKGRWKIDKWVDSHPTKGPIVAYLSPVGHDAHGRSAFRIHGDNAEMNHTASEGCIVTGRVVREAWRKSKDVNLEVVA